MDYCGKCGALLKTNQSAQSSAKKICPNCNWKWYEPPIPVVVVLLSNVSNDIVYVRHSDFPTNVWSLISGYVQVDETAEDAAVREVKEETGLDSEVVNFAGSIVSINKRSELFLTFHCRILGGELQAGDDAEFVEIGKPDIHRVPNGTIAQRMITKYLNNTYSLKL
jgi:NAD+ diphosphatase